MSPAVGPGFSYREKLAGYVDNRSMTRIIATPPPAFSLFSGRPLLQLHTSPFLTVKSLPGPWLTRNSPSRQWQTMSFAMPEFIDLEFG